MNKFVFLFLTTVLFRTAAFATPHVSGGLFDAPSEFRKLIEKSQATCADMICPQAVVKARKATATQWSSLAKETRDLIHDQVKQRAEDWNDTILEGDYQAKGRTTLDAVYFLEQDQKIVGFRFVFSRQAWDTSTCEFDDSHPNVEGCDQGRIVDAAFLSADLSEVFQDEQSYAHFVADKN